MNATSLMLLVLGTLATVFGFVGCTDQATHRHPHPFERRELQTAIGVLRHDDTGTWPEQTVRRRSLVNAVGTDVDNDDQISPRCNKDLILFNSNRNAEKNSGFSPQGSDWGNQMFDATGRLQAGVLQGHFFWMGDFWECLRLQVWHNNTKGGEPDFKGKYCLTTMQILFLPMPVFKIGMCVPSTCSAKDLQLSAAQTNTFPFNSNFNDDFCQVLDHSPWDSVAVGTGVLFCFIIALLCIATLFELSLIVKRKLGPKTVNFDLGEKSNKQITLCSEGCSGSFLKELLLAFSAIRNLKQVFNTTRSGVDLGVIHGMRTISMSWVVLGHSMLLVHHEFPWKNQYYAAKFNHDFLMQAMLAGEFAVDTFFCLSGFLMGYLFLKEMKQKDGAFNVFQFVFHRIWRLTPAYAIVVMYMSGLYPEIGKGPLWPATTADRAVCQDKWWQNLLYMNVYFDETVKCLPQAWYLCIDIVFYLVSPIILWPLHKKRELGLIIFGIFVIVSFITPAALIYKDDLPAYPAWNVDPAARDVFMHLIYDKPWCRMSAYLVGMAYGYIFFLKGSTLKLHPIVVAVGWLSAIAINLSLTYGTYDYSIGEKSMYTGMFVVYGSLTRPAWTLGIGWVILTCLTGYGGYVNSILSWKGFIPLSKLSYTMYLVHFTMIAQFYATRVESTYIDYYTLTFIGTTMFFTSIGVALLLTISAESPFIQMEKLISKCFNNKNKNQGNSVDYKPLKPSGFNDGIDKQLPHFAINDDSNSFNSRPPPPSRKFNGTSANHVASESENEVFYDPDSDHVVSGHEDSFDDDDDEEETDYIKIQSMPIFKYFSGMRKKHAANT